MQVDTFYLPPFDIFSLKYWLFEHTVSPWLSKACEYEARDWVSNAKHLAITFRTLLLNYKCETYQYPGLKARFRMMITRG